MYCLGLSRFLFTANPIVYFKFNDCWYNSITKQQVEIINCFFLYYSNLFNTIVNFIYIRRSNEQAVQQ